MKGDKANCKHCKIEFVKKSFVQVFCERYCSKLYAIEKAKRLEITNRFVILERDNFKCFYCGKSSFEEDARLMVDHVIPTSKGGYNIPSNMVTSCTACNYAKSDMDLNPDNLKRIQIELERRNKI